jgi:hypothetical protein
LAVGGCADRAPSSDEEQRQCRELCGRGCPPLNDVDEIAYDAWWIDDAGFATAVGLEGIAAPRPILIPGSDGSPWLVAATAEEPTIPRLFRFDPWRARFALSDVPDGLRLPRPGRPAPISVDPDAFVWLDDDEQHGELLGLRLGTRNRFTQDLALVLLSEPMDPGRPRHLVPSRPLDRFARRRGSASGSAARQERARDRGSLPLAFGVEKRAWADGGAHRTTRYTGLSFAW